MDNNRYKAPALAALLSMTKQAIYHNLKLKKLDAGFKEKLKEKNVNIFLQENNMESEIDLSKVTPIAHQLIIQMRERIKAQDRVIVLLEEKVSRLESRN